MILESILFTLSIFAQGHLLEEEIRGIDMITQVEKVKIINPPFNSIGNKEMEIIADIIRN